MSTMLTIQAIGAQGDGIAHWQGQTVHVPFTLPGEVANAAIDKGRADIVSLVESAPDRVEPPCRHFGRCGGCALQHWQDDAYRTWKREKLVQTLRGAGIEAPVDPILACPPASRRRAVFAVRRTEAGMMLGFNAAMSRTIVDIEECHVVLPEIAARLGSLRRAAQAVCATDKAFKLTATQTASGLDLAFTDSGSLTERTRQNVVKMAIAEDFARVSVDGEIIIEPRKPIVMIDDIAVAIPPAAFMQAVAQAEAAMAEIAIAHLRKAKRVVDLFSGWGAFGLRLARHATVHAVESDAAALASLDAAFRHAAGMKTVTIERRDLYRRPLTFKELKAYDGVLFDPPRAGAEDQARQLARASVRRVVAVSCNPVTLARDLAILHAGGYRTTRVVPIDQFVWSPHVEAVALLEKR